MANHEWRVLPLTNWLPDEIGAVVFLFSHILLFSVVVALIASTNEKVRNRSRVIISVFLIVHGILHSLFSGSKAYEFTSLASSILIYGGAALGAIFLAIELHEKYSVKT